MIAGLLGAATALRQVSITEYSGTYVDYEYLSAAWGATFDWGYSTLYENGPIEDDEWLQEGYGFRVWSNATYTFSVELFNFYTYSGEVFFNFFDIAPLKVYLAWYRPEYTYIEETGFWDMRLIGKYDLRGPYF